MDRPRSFKRSCEAYEAWLRMHCAAVDDDLARKHALMSESPFRFLRATYFRWAETIPARCPELQDAPAVPAVGDVHVENFGTWRDAEGRLVWGINDFDEAAKMPYTWDLVRLVTSAMVSHELTIDVASAAAEALRGYREGLEAPAPWVLDAGRSWLRAWVGGSPRQNQRFWAAIDGLPEVRPPPAVRRGLKRALPASARQLRFASRSAGGGSLGRPRYLAMASWQGAGVVREAKAEVPSAWLWARGKRSRSLLMELATSRYRSPDPHLDLRDGYVYRRLAPDSRKLDLAELDGEGFGPDLLRAMGNELAAIHAASGRGERIAADLLRRPPDWLASAALAAEAQVSADFQAWTSLRAAPPAPAKARRRPSTAA